MIVLNQSLLLIDAVAVIFIVLFHAQGFYPLPIDQVLRVSGLALFSFSAGYKFMYNHHQDLQNKVFLKSYMITRFKRLYKPYIGYTLLILPIWAVIIWIGRNIFNLNYSGLNVFDNPIIDTVWLFVIGQNPFGGHLWYLVMLLEVTFLCLLVLYVFNIKILFGLGFTCLSVLIFQYAIEFLFSMSLATDILILIYVEAIEFGYLSNIIKYGSIYIIGMFIATKVTFPEKLATPLLTPLLVIGSYSFYIYLFQWPFLLPIPGKLLYDILNINSIFVPIFLVLFVVATSIVIYRIMNVFGINRLIE
ncbi:MAG: acyltransferase family protein [Methanothrix sp.]